MVLGFKIYVLGLVPITSILFKFDHIILQGPYEFQTKVIALTYRISRSPHPSFYLLDQLQLKKVLFELILCE
jgi:hypothetical protein